jgi:hypothetical protein
MSRKKAEAASPPPVSAIADGELSRNQFEAGERCLSTLCRGMETFGKIQSQAAHHAAAYHAEVARRVHSPKNGMDLLAIEADVMRFEIQETMQMWQQLGTAALELQRELLAGAWQATQGDGSSMNAMPAFAPFMGTGAAADTRHRQA